MLAREATTIRKLGIDVLATTAEPAPGEDPEKAKQIIKETNFSFASGFVAGEVVERMLVFHRHLFYSPYHMTVPSSVLLDGKGRLIAVYRGAVALPTLENHVEALSIPDEDLLTSIRLFDGSRLEPAGTPKPSMLIKEYLERRMPDEAERTLTSEITDESIADQLPEVMATIAQSYLLQKDFENARRLFLVVVERNTKDAPSRNSLAAILLKQGRTADAKRLWMEACRLDDNFGPPRFNLGKQLMKEQQTSEAMALFLEYHALEPEDPDAHNYLSIGYLRSKEFQKAEFHLRRLIQLRPDDGIAYTNLAKVYLSLRNLSAAREIVNLGLQAEGIDPRSRQTLQKMREQL